MKIKIPLFILLIALLMPSCIVYHQMAADIPLISESNDLRIDAGVALVLPSAHATVSYGLTDKIAIQGFGSVGAADDYYFQAATGLYKNRGNNKIVEFYGGFGYGYGDAYRDANPGNLLGNYQLYFGQFNYGKVASETSTFEVGFAFKAGYLHSNLIDENYYDNVLGYGPFKTYYDESILLEPVGFIRMGGGRLKFSVKLGATKIFKLTNTDKRIPYGFLNLGVGFNYRL